MVLNCKKRPPRTLKYQNKVPDLHCGIMNRHIIIRINVNFFRRKQIENTMVKIGLFWVLMLIILL